MEIASAELQSDPLVSSDNDTLQDIQDELLRVTAQDDALWLMRSARCVPMRERQCYQIPFKTVHDVINADNLTLEKKLALIVENWRALEIDCDDVDALLQFVSVREIISLTQGSHSESQAEKFVRLCTVVSPRASSYFMRAFLDNITCFSTAVVTRVVTDCCVNLVLDPDELDLVFNFAKAQLNSAIATYDWVKLMFRVSKSLPLCQMRAHYATFLRSHLETVRERWMNGRVLLDRAVVPDFGRMVASVAKTVQQILGPTRAGFNPDNWFPFLASFDMQYKAAKVCGIAVYVPWDSLPYKLKNNW